MTSSKFLRKYGGYIIDFTFGVFSIIAVVDFFVRDANHTAAFGIIALYSFGVIFRVRYVQKHFDQTISTIVDAQEKSITDMAKRHADEIERLRNPKTPGS